MTTVNPLSPGSLTTQRAIQQARGTAGFAGGQAGAVCADTPGEACRGTGGGLTAVGSVTSSMQWTLHATLPAAPFAGPGTPIAVFTTSGGIEGRPCLLVLAGAPAPGVQVTCAATTAGIALQGSAVVLVFPGVLGAAGPVVGPAVVAGPDAAIASTPPPYAAP